VAMLQEVTMAMDVHNSGNQGLGQGVVIQDIQNRILMDGLLNPKVCQTNKKHKFKGATYKQLTNIISITKKSLVIQNKVSNTGFKNFMAPSVVHAEAVDHTKSTKEGEL
jgi:hypothetical protein